jgi:hypothetical protein
MPLKFYTQHDFDEIIRAQTIDHLHHVAERVLARAWAASPDGGVGIACGPISTGGLGSRAANLCEFEKYITALARQGHVIFSQMPFEDAMARVCTPEEYLRDPHHLLEGFYLPLFESGMIGDMYFIPGWEASTGARWEHEQALRLRIRITYLRHHTQI